MDREDYHGLTLEVPGMPRAEDWEPKKISTGTKVALWLVGLGVLVTIVTGAVLVYRALA